MLGGAASKTMWVGKATTFCVGLAVVLALVLGANSAALATLPGDPFKLDQSNRVDRLTTLVSTLDGKSTDKIGVNGWRGGRGGARGGNEVGRW